MKGCHHLPAHHTSSSECLEEGGTCRVCLPSAKTHLLKSLHQSPISSPSPFQKLKGCRRAAHTKMEHASDLPCSPSWTYAFTRLFVSLIQVTIFMQPASSNWGYPCSCSTESSRGPPSSTWAIEHGGVDIMVCSLPLKAA